jgi:hypothetical protein
MSLPHAQPVLRFHRLIPAARAPQRASRDGAGTLPIRAARYCDAVTTACAWGYWVFAPMDLSLYWDGDSLFWSCALFPEWMALDDAAQFPHFADAFDAMAPEAARGAAPPFLTRLPEPGAVQIWTGLIARTAPDWSLVIRPPVNLPLSGGYTLFEGILEPDLWCGPLFANLRLTRSHAPVRLAADLPLLQVQPLPRLAYGEAAHAMELAEGLGAAEWEAYGRDIVAPNADPDRAPGRYARAARRRRRCPAHADA